LKKLLINKYFSLFNQESRPKKSESIPVCSKRKFSLDIKKNITETSDNKFPKFEKHKTVYNLQHNSPKLNDSNISYSICKNAKKSNTIINFKKERPIKATPIMDKRANSLILPNLEDNKKHFKNSIDIIDPREETKQMLNNQTIFNRKRSNGFQIENTNKNSIFQYTRKSDLYLNDIEISENEEEKNDSSSEKNLIVSRSKKSSFYELQIDEGLKHTNFNNKYFDNLEENKSPKFSPIKMNSTVIQHLKSKSYYGITTLINKSIPSNDFETGSLDKNSKKKIYNIKLSNTNYPISSNHKKIFNETSLLRLQEKDECKRIQKEYEMNLNSKNTRFQVGYNNLNKGLGNYINNKTIDISDDFIQEKTNNKNLDKNYSQKSLNNKSNNLHKNNNVKNLNLENIQSIHKKNQKENANIINTNTPPSLKDTDNKKWLLNKNDFFIKQNEDEEIRGIEINKNMFMYTFKDNENRKRKLFEILKSGEKIKKLKMK